MWESEKASPMRLWFICGLNDECNEQLKKGKEGNQNGPVHIIRENAMLREGQALCCVNEKLENKMRESALLTL